MVYNALFVIIKRCINNIISLIVQFLTAEKNKTANKPFSAR